MKQKMMAAFVLSLLLLGFATPLLSGADALDYDDYYVTVPDTNAPREPVKATLGNGESQTWPIYVVNVSDSYLNVTYKSTSSISDVKVTGLPSTTLLGPMGTTEGHISSGEIVIAADKLSDAYDSVEVDVIVCVTDIAEPNSTQEIHIVFDLKIESIYDTSSVYNKFFGIIPNTLGEPLNGAWLPAIVTIFGIIIISIIIGSLILAILTRHFSKNSTEEEIRKFKRSVLELVIPLVALWTINLALMIMDADVRIMSVFMEVSVVLGIILAVAIAWKIYVFVIVSFLTGFEKLHGDSSIDTSLIPLFKMIGRIIFWVSGVSLILNSFGVDLQGILVSAGVISLGITLGAQNVLSQFFSGLVLLTTRPFKAGDFLKLNDKVYIVRRVKLMYTEFTNWAGDEVITMPNNTVSSATISNLTKGDLLCKLYVYFSVAYGTDLKKAEKVMIETARKCSLVVEDATHEGPSVRVTDFLSSGIEMRLAVYTPTFDDTGAAAGQLRALIYEAFNENDIEIPYDRIQIDVLSDRTRTAE
jgi:small-conductance mechanosensitive channel